MNIDNFKIRRLTDLRTKLSSLFTGAFFKTTAKLDLTPDGHVGGYLVSDGFRGMNQSERGMFLWNFLAESLSEYDLEDVGMILTFTPLEAEGLESDLDE